MAVATVRHKDNLWSLSCGTNALRKAAIGICVFSLAGCAMGGVSIEKAAPDSSTITGSVMQPQPVETDTGKLSDQSAIKNVVSALNFMEWGKSLYHGPTPKRAARARSRRLPRTARTISFAVSSKPRVKLSTVFPFIAARLACSVAVNGR